MKNKKIPIYSLVLLIIASVDSIRNLPTAALFGSPLIFFFIFSALVFLIPISLVAAELSATFPEKGGIYHWIQSAFGQKWAMVAIWLQWISTMVWYPTALSFIAGTAAYLINPDLAQNKSYLVSCILIIVWGVTFINLKGLHFSLKLTNICAIVGTVIPLILLIAMGAAWVFTGMPLQIEVNSQTVIPSLSNADNWVSLIAIMASFLGMELAGVHVNDIRDPQKNFPKAVFYSGSFILATMLFGSLAIALVLPVQDINLVAGTMQVFTNFLHVFGLKSLIPFLTICIVLGTLGGQTNWLISPAKGLLHAAEFGYLPPFFKKKNKHGVTHTILIAQALVISLLTLVFLLQPTVNAFYWFLTALSTELYMLMYVLMFLSALFLHYRYKERPKSFKIPGRVYGLWVTCLLGLFGCLCTIVVCFFPLKNVNIGSPLEYIMKVVVGNILTISPVLLFYLYKNRKVSVK